MVNKTICSLKTCLPTVLPTPTPMSPYSSTVVFLQHMDEIEHITPTASLYQTLLVFRGYFA